MQAEAIREYFRDAFPTRVLFFSSDGGHETWREVLDALPYVPATYQVSSVVYQGDYMRGFLSAHIDLSIIIYHGDQPIGIWPLSLNIKENAASLATNEAPVYTPLYKKGISSKLIRRYNAMCLNSLTELYCFLKRKKYSLMKTWKSQVSFLSICNYEANQLWYRQLMERGGRATPQHELYVDLSLSMEELHQRIRKSYRSLIHNGEKIWNVRVHEDVTHEMYTEYRLLHKEVAGRVTRSIETWDDQEHAIHNGESFFISIHNETNALIGGSVYTISRDEGNYATGVYRRDLFDKPVSHVSLWRAISHMKQKGLRWMRVGTRFYSGDMPCPTEKELQISYFKEGFATDMFFHVVVESTFLESGDV